MRNRRTFYITATLVLMRLAGLGDGSARGGSIYQVSVDTTSIQGISGDMDLIFDAASTSSQVAYATVTDFSTNGMLATSAQYDGDASGLLPGTLSLDNGVDASPPQSFNDVYQGISFGTTLSFDVTLSGPAVDSPDSSGSGSTFSLILYDASGNTLLTTDTTYGGSVAVLNLNPDGSTTPLTFPATPGGSPAGAVVAAGGAVPEPASLVLLVLAMPAGVLLRRRRSGH